MIPIRRVLLLIALALAAVGLVGGTTASFAQQACVDVYVEANGTVLVDQGVCLPPALQ